MVSLSYKILNKKFSPFSTICPKFLHSSDSSISKFSRIKKTQCDTLWHGLRNKNVQNFLCCLHILWKGEKWKEKQINFKYILEISVTLQAIQEDNTMLSTIINHLYINVYLNYYSTNKTDLNLLISMINSHVTHEQKPFMTHWLTDSYSCFPMLLSEK